MPVIEFNSGGENFPLKTVPPDGFVKARALTYDEMLTRRDLAAKMVYRQKVESGKQSSNGKSFQGHKQKQSDVTPEELEMMMESANSAVQRFQFGVQILDHNLEYEAGRKINFSNPAHLKKLPSKIGAEIEDILDSLNEADEEDEDFPERSTTSSPDQESEAATQTSAS